MKIAKQNVISSIGHGCSREAVLLSNGLICKLPRYNNSMNCLGRPLYTVLNELMDEFKDDSSIRKIVKLLAKGFKFPAPCMGIVAEYLFSLKIRDTNEAKYFAKCLEITVRKKRLENVIDVKGFYENALNKTCEDFEVWDIMEELPYEIEDLHYGNFVNGYIVDYAALTK